MNIFLIKSALHHDPADCTLKATKKKEDDHGIDHVGLETPLQNENDEWNGEDHAHKPRPNAVKPFPEIDEFEFGKREIEIDLFELGDLFVLTNRGLPVRLIEWR